MCIRVGANCRDKWSAPQGEPVERPVTNMTAEDQSADRKQQIDGRSEHPREYQHTGGTAEQEKWQHNYRTSRYKDADEIKKLEG